MNIKSLLITCLTVIVFTQCSCLKESASSVNTVGNTDSLSNITGKWFWYKTLIHDTSGGRTGIDTFYNDYSTYDFSNNQIVYTSAYYKSNNTTVNDSMKYYVKAARIGFVRFTSPTDTGWFDIKSCNSNNFMMYTKSIYTTTNPPTAVEYWQYFAK